jgi:hypothetical protein
MMEAKAIPAIKRRPSLQSNVRSLFSSLEVDDMVPAAVPAMMMMPSFVYYHVISPFHSPFHRMAKSMMPMMWSKFGFESSEEDEEEEEEEEAEESKKIEEIAKVEPKKLVKESGINQASSAEEKESNVESPQEEEETQTENEQEQVTTESVTEETQSIDGNEDQVTTTEFPAANTESTDPPTTEEENSINTEATTTEFQQMDDKAIIVEDQLLITKSPSHPVKTSSGRSSSTTYVCKFGKCQHTMEAKQLLEQEIEAELWAKL